MDMWALREAHDCWRKTATGGFEDFLEFSTNTTVDVQNPAPPGMVKTL